MLRLALTALIALLATNAAAQNWTISAPGTYTLSANSTSTGLYNIKITASDVTLNLNGKIVQCNAGPAAASYGIFVDSGKSNVTITNGRIVGCRYGVYAGGVTNGAVEGLDLTGSRYIGVHGLRFVRDSIFASITGYAPGNGYAIAVNAPAANCIIERNQFRNLYRQALADPGDIGEGAGIIVGSGTTGCTIRYNWFDNTAFGGHMNIGIWVATGATATVVENSLTNFERAIIVPGSATVTDNRLWLRGPVAGSNAIHAMAGSVTQNLIVGFETPLSGDAPASDNLIVPP